MTSALSESQYSVQSEFGPSTHSNCTVCSPLYPFQVYHHVRYTNSDFGVKITTYFLYGA